MCVFVHLKTDNSTYQYTKKKISAVGKQNSSQCDGCLYNDGVYVHILNVIAVSFI